MKFQVDPLMIETFTTLATANGTGHFLLVAGIAVASSAVNHKLKQAKRDTAVFVCDRITYVSGGLVLMDLLFKVLRTAMHLFSQF